MSEKSTRIVVGNINCSSCKGHIETALSKMQGIGSIIVNVVTSEALLTYDPNEISMNEILLRLKQIGYPSVEKKVEHESTVNMVLLYLKAVICTLIASTLFVVDMSHMLFRSQMLPLLTQWILASIVQFYGGWGFTRQAIKSLQERVIGMDALIVLGTISAYLFSTISWWIHFDTELYFETPSVIIALVLWGRLLETKAKTRAKKGMKALISLQSTVARRMENGQEKTVPIDQIAVDDLIAVSPGERMPVDGEIVQGHTSVDESIITGEAMFVQKKVGDHVVGGSLNHEGALLIKCSKVGSEALLGRMIDLIEKAQSSKPKIQRFVDKIALIFVPIVMAIAFCAFAIGWYHHSFEVAIINLVATLVIACPCALGLATPTVVVVCASRAAKKGILIKDFTDLEFVGKVKTIIFDKTGTITEGKMRIIETPTDPHVVEIAKCLARYSSHPLAKAIGKNNISAKEAKEEFGRGVVGKLNDKKVYLGSESFLRELGVKIDREIPKKTVVLIGEENKLVGLYAFEDTLREDAEYAIFELKKRNIKLVLLSGDNKEVVEALGAFLHFDRAVGGVTPEGKANYVEMTKELCAVVGDGVNDALALSKADVSIAMGSGSDVAMEAANIGIMQTRVSAVVDLVDLGRVVKKRILQNIFFAFAYNITALPLAAFGLVNPMIAALAMSMSSILVVTNALRKY